MNVDPSNPDAPDENLLRQAYDVANGAPAAPRGEPTQTLADALHTAIGRVGLILIDPFLVAMVRPDLTQLPAWIGLELQAPICDHEDIVPR